MSRRWCGRGVIWSLGILLLLIASAGSMAGWQDVELGHYNLADYEAAAGEAIDVFRESPMLADRVASGELPPIGERLPANPLVQIPLSTMGEYGGTLRYTDLNIGADIYQRHINNSNLFTRAASAEFDTFSGLAGPSEPGVLESFSMSEDGLVFEASIRQGLRWSDGEPVTTADVAYRFNDELSNPEITGVTPRWMRWGGGTVTLEIVDDYAFRFIFTEPYGAFIEHELREWPGHYSQIIRPKHFLSQYHIDYADPQALEELMEDAGYYGVDEWDAYYLSITGIYNQDNVETSVYGVFPTLDPYMPVEDLGGGDWLYERNPYFYMVDPAGQQLPYIDRLRRTYVADEEMMNMSIIAGDTDVQAQYISLENFPLYRMYEERGDYSVMALRSWQDHLQIFVFNMAHADPEIREVLGDVRFRRALSLALDREYFREGMFMGFGTPAQACPREGVPYYEESMARAWADYDPEQAKALLDEMGFVDQTGDGWRDLPSGEPFILAYDFFIVGPLSVPAAEVAQRYWEAVGVRMDVRQVDGGYFWQIRGSNEFMATGWWIGGAGRAPHLEFNISGPMWVQWRNTDGEQGIEPEPWAKRMFELADQRAISADEDERNELRRQMWQLQAEYLPVLGVVTGAKTPFVYSNDLGNIGVAEERDYTNAVILDHATQWFFVNPDRR